MPSGNYMELQNDGSLQEKVALELSGGAIDANKIPKTDATGRLHKSFMPEGIGADTQGLVASEDMLKGTLVNQFNDAGVVKVRKANAALGHEATGFIKDDVVAGAVVLVYFEGNNPHIATVTSENLGKTAFVSATPGEISFTPPAAGSTGHISQAVGRVTSTNNLNFEAKDAFIRA